MQLQPNIGIRMRCSCLSLNLLSAFLCLKSFEVKENMTYLAYSFYDKKTDSDLDVAVC